MVGTMDLVTPAVGPEYERLAWLLGRSDGYLLSGEPEGPVARDLASYWQTRGRSRPELTAEATRDAWPRCPARPREGVCMGCK
jgi:hypothetical protein